MYSYETKTTKPRLPAELTEDAIWFAAQAVRSDRSLWVSPELQEAFVGICTYALHNRARVPPLLLWDAIKLCKELLDNNCYLTAWGDKEARTYYLSRELAALEKADKNRGKP
jgi:hypothetical protein